MFEVNQCPKVNLVLTNLLEGLTELFDVIIFNPVSINIPDYNIPFKPYVATDSDELTHAQEQKGIEASYAGGEHGIEILK